jgi:hypothetical protein
MKWLPPRFKDYIRLRERVLAIEKLVRAEEL